MCVMVDTFMDLRRHIWGGYFLLSTFWGKVYLVFSALLLDGQCVPSLLSPSSSHCRVLGLQTMAFGFSFSNGLWGLISGYWFYLQSYPKAQSFAFDFLLAVVTFLL